MMVTLGKRLESDAQMLCCASLSARVCRSLAPVWVDAKQFLLVAMLQSKKHTHTFRRVQKKKKKYSSYMIFIPPFLQYQALQCEAPSSRWRLLFLPQCRQKPPGASPQQGSQTCLKTTSAFLKPKYTKLIEIKSKGNVSETPSEMF